MQSIASQETTTDQQQIHLDESNLEIQSFFDYFEQKLSSLRDHFVVYYGDLHENVKERTAAKEDELSNHLKTIRA
jgi:hypothetical protein